MFFCFMGLRISGMFFFCLFVVFLFVCLFVFFSTIPCALENNLALSLCFLYSLIRLGPSCPL